MIEIKELKCKVNNQPLSSIVLANTVDRLTNTEDGKQCKTCNVTKPFSFFSTEKTKAGNITYRPYCKECRAEEARDSRKEKMSRSCTHCGASWVASSGKVRRTPGLCDECYPVYRASYSIWHAAKRRADESNMLFDITPEFIFNLVAFGYCPRTGLEFRIEDKGSNYSNRHPQTPSIDKIDPTKGYTKDNIQVVCWWYNSAKARYTDEQVLQLCMSVINQALLNMSLAHTAGQATPEVSTQTDTSSVKFVESTNPVMEQLTKELELKRFFEAV
jgi:hypothetical protein